MSTLYSDTHGMDVQKIVVTLSEPDLVIEPGTAGRLSVTMINRQDTPDRLLLEVEGIDIEWYNIPVPAINVAPGAQVTERINFKVARNSANHAGSYSFLVRVVAMETGEVGVAQAMLIVKPFDSLQLELSPKRALATFFRPLNDFEIAIVNEGNAEENLELYASDPDDDCAFEFDNEHVTLKPGQTQTILMAARPKASSWLGSPHLYSFSVSARASDDSYVSAKAQGQIEKRALVSPVAGVLLLLLLFGGGAWTFFRPRPLAPVKLIDFAATPPTIVAGDPVTLTWNVAGDSPTIKLKHRIGKGGTDVYDGILDKPVGNAQFKPETRDASGSRIAPQITYAIEVSNRSTPTISKDVTINVMEPPIQPRPVLKSFDADSTMVHAGEQVSLSWKATGAEYFIIDPGALKLSNQMQSTLVTPDHDTDYQIRAFSPDGRLQSTPRTLKINVVSRDTPISKIVDFTAHATVYIGDKIRLRWVCKRTRGVRIDSDKGDVIGAGLAESGAQDVVVNDHVTFTLTAADNLGKAVTKQVTIDPKPRPAPPLPEPTTTDPGTTPVPPTPMPNPPNDGANPTPGTKP